MVHSSFYIKNKRNKYIQHKILKSMLFANSFTKHSNESSLYVLKHNIVNSPLTDTSVGQTPLYNGHFLLVPNVFSRIYHARKPAYKNTEFLAGECSCLKEHLMFKWYMNENFSLEVLKIAVLYI